MKKSLLSICYITLISSMIFVQQASAQLVETNDDTHSEIEAQEAEQESPPLSCKPTPNKFLSAIIGPFAYQYTFHELAPAIRDNC